MKTDFNIKTNILNATSMEDFIYLIKESEKR